MKIQFPQIEQVKKNLQETSYNTVVIQIPTHKIEKEIVSQTSRNPIKQECEPHTHPHTHIISS